MLRSWLALCVAYVAAWSMVVGVLFTLTSAIPFGHCGNWQAGAVGVAIAAAFDLAFNRTLLLLLEGLVLAACVVRSARTWLIVLAGIGLPAAWEAVTTAILLMRNGAVGVSWGREMAGAAFVAAVPAVLVCSIAVMLRHRAAAGAEPGRAAWALPLRTASLVLAFLGILGLVNFLDAEARRAAQPPRKPPRIASEATPPPEFSLADLGPGPPAHPVGHSVGVLAIAALGAALAHRFARASGRETGSGVA